MTTRQTLDQLLGDLPEDRVREVLDFARFLNWREERETWQRFGETQLAKAYGPDEPEYSETDLMPDISP